VDWSHVVATVELSDEERQIVQMLAAKKSLPDIAKSLGQHRSMIWRKVERIKARLQER
jgi:IS30 family transposase